MTTEELLSGMVTEEVEPGVFRVVNDGVRDLSYPVGGWGVSGFMVDVTPDGSVWLSARAGGQGLFRLGEEPVFEDLEGFPPYREVAPDGSLWAIGDVPDDRSGIFSFDGEGWTVRATTTDDFSALAVGPDGTVWVAAIDRDKYCPDIEAGDCSGIVLLRLEDDGSLTTIEDWSDVYDGDAVVYQLAVSPDGDVWLVGTSARARGPSAVALRWRGMGSHPGSRGMGPRRDGPVPRLRSGRHAVGEGQAHGGGLARFDDPGWTTFTEADGAPAVGRGGLALHGPAQRRRRRQPLAHRQPDRRGRLRRRVALRRHDMDLVSGGVLHPRLRHRSRWQRLAGG